MSDIPRRRSAGDLLSYLVYAVCGLLLLIELVYHRHSYSALEGTFGFYAIMGFGAYLTVVFTAKGLRRLVRRPEDYYDRPVGTPAEREPDDG
jgi:uncharacterized membrane protein